MCVSRSAGWGGTASLNEHTNKAKNARYSERRRRCRLHALLARHLPMHYHPPEHHIGLGAWLDFPRSACMALTCHV